MSAPARQPSEAPAPTVAAVAGAGADRARGLFRRAIAQSVPGTFFSDEPAADIAGALAEELGSRPTVADL